MSTILESLLHPPRLERPPRIPIEPAARVGPMPVQPANEVPAMGKPRPKTAWTLAELLAAKFPEPRWAVPGLLPVGLCLLSGRPKLGKSFLALQLALAVGSGGRFLDRPIEQGRALCICLEDSPRRLQGRLQSMEATGGEIDFAFAWPPLNGDGLNRLRDYVAEHNPRLVTIDTLTRSFTGRIDWDSVGQTTAVLGALQQLALEADCCILSLDHQRKPGPQSQDVIDDVLGSTAKAAVCDCVWGLYRKRGESTATLRVTGRDVEEAELALAFDRTTCCWQLAENEGVKPDSVQGQILAALENVGAMTVSELSIYLSKHDGHIARELQELAAKGLVRKRDPSRYAPYVLTCD